MMKNLLKITEIAALRKSAQFQNYQRCRSQILIAQIEDLNENCVIISRLFYLLYFPRNRPSKSVTIGPCRFIILNDSASPKMVINIYLKNYRCFSKVLELFECRRGNLYITANSRAAESLV